MNQLLLNLLLLLSILLIASCNTCNKIKEVLDDDTLTMRGPPSNNICLLSGESCCDKSVEQKLLAKTREVLKNRLFLLLNKFYKNMDKDKRDKEDLLQNMLKTTQLKQTEKQRYSTLLSQYSYGKNKFTVDDITVLANAMALGTVSKNVGTTVSGACEERLYFELEGLKKAENKYLGTILLMLKGYVIGEEMITAATRPDLTDECYIAAVRGGLKFGGCELCRDDTQSKTPCVKLCRNIISGCLKGHLELVEKLRDWTEHQWKLEAERMRALQDRDTAFDNLMGEIKSKLRSDNDFHLNCKALGVSDIGRKKKSVYTAALPYEKNESSKSLDAGWQCTYVFASASEVNCWNRTGVGEYYLNVYEFTEDGQFQNPEVPGEGPEVDLDDIKKEFSLYKSDVAEIEAGRTVLKAGASSTFTTAVIRTLLVLVVFYLF